jgi:curved DNA-binding protein CbpA
MAGLPSQARTHYKALQVDTEADLEIIQVCYRKLAQRYHPDHDASPAATVQMAAINAAFAVLKDPEKRGAYDRELQRSRDRRATDRRVRQTGFGAAGTPQGPVSGSVLEFGRYAGWSLGQIARVDPEFLEWLARVPIGMTYRAEIAALIGARASQSVPAVPAARKGIFARR